MTLRRVFIVVLLLFVISGLAIYVWFYFSKTPVSAPSLSVVQENISKPNFPLKEEVFNEKTVAKNSAFQLWSEAELRDKSDKQRFYKVDIDGQLLPDSASHWECVYDRLTELLWEVKTNDGGWQDQQHTYSWYEPVELEFSQYELELEGKPEFGTADSGICYDIQCDTSSYQIAVNQEKLCASTEWRLPYAHELGFLNHKENYYPDIDTDYFPHTAVAYYWSRTEAPSADTLAWAVNFQNGFPYISEKRMAYRVRLVADALWLGEQLYDKDKQVK